MADRMAELLKRQFEKQSAAGPKNASAGDASERRASERQASERLEAVLERLVAQQEQTNEHLRQQQISQEATTQELRDWRATTQRSFAQTFFRKMALEVPPVVLAVLLAFGINSWWQNNKQEQLTRIARENIVREMQNNQAALENNIRNNQSRVVEVSTYLKKHTQDPTDTANTPMLGVEMYTLTEAAWAAAGLSGVLPNLDQKFVMAASKIYQVQLTRSGQIEGYLTSMTGVETKKAENLLPSVLQNEAILNDMVHNDEFLLRLYTEFLDKYGPTAAAE